MDWGGLASLFGLGVKVVHRLPGRVRVHVPRCCGCAEFARNLGAH